MRTINQTLKASDIQLGHWTMWVNDVLGRLDRLMVKPKRYIPVTFETSEYRRAKDGTFECQHAATFEGRLWSDNTDAGREVAVIMCASCDKYYEEETGTWM